MQRALLAGIPPDRIVFSGVGKQPRRNCWQAAAGRHRPDQRRKRRGAGGAVRRRPPPPGTAVAVALRINPDVDAGTHAKITTGRADNKFGIGLDTAAALYAHAASLPGVRPGRPGAAHRQPDCGTTAPYRAAFARVADLVRTLRDRRANRHAAWIAAAASASATVTKTEGSPAAFAGADPGAMLGGMGLDLMIEPGRWLAGPVRAVCWPASCSPKPPPARRFTGAGRGHERPGAPGHVRRLARHRSRTWQRPTPSRPCPPHRHRRPRVRDPGTPLRDSRHASRRLGPARKLWRSSMRVLMVRS